MFKQEYTSGSEERRLVVLKAIGNSGLDLVTFLEQIVLNNATTMELRVNSIYAMRRISDLKKVIDVLLPIYRNWMTPVELRIAAFNPLIDVDATEDMLVTLVSHLNQEPIMQLGNYVYSFLDSLVNIPTIFSPTRNL